MQGTDSILKILFKIENREEIAAQYGAPLVEQIHQSFEKWLPLLSQLDQIERGKLPPIQWEIPGREETSHEGQGRAEPFLPVQRSFALKPINAVVLAASLLLLIGIVASIGIVRR